MILCFLATSLCHAQNINAEEIKVNVIFSAKRLQHH